MAKWLVVERAQADRVYHAGWILDDSEHDIPRLAAQGVPLVEYIPAIHDAPLAAYRKSIEGRQRTDHANLLSLLENAAGSGVDSVFGRQGNVVALDGDYDASQIDFDNTASGLTAGNVQDAIDELAQDGVGTGKAGTAILANFSGSPLVAFVTFGVPFTDTSYAVITQAVASSGRTFAVHVENKTAAGFEIHLTTSRIFGLSEVLWFATPF